MSKSMNEKYFSSLVMLIVGAICIIVAIAIGNSALSTSGIICILASQLLLPRPEE